ncbi:hypothetical protein ACH5RR_029461 [Cinchona calisaya]|uniref:Uncharacterized protein n=1 Tax=Cinchona calisaya TaxID=153742 RepID=A0ABD2YV96_9GENT
MASPALACCPKKARGEMPSHLRFKCRDLRSIVFDRSLEAQSSTLQIRGASQPPLLCRDHIAQQPARSLSSTIFLGDVSSSKFHGLVVDYSRSGSQVWSAMTD